MTCEKLKCEFWKKKMLEVKKLKDFMKETLKMEKNLTRFH